MLQVYQLNINLIDILVSAANSFFTVYKNNFKHLIQEELDKDPTQGREIDLIYISKANYKQVKYLIGQSIQGNHVLFDSDSLRRVFQKQLPHEFLEIEEAYSVEPLIERMITLPTLSEQKDFIKTLDSDTFEKFVRTYFNIIESNLLEATESRH